MKVITSFLIGLSSGIIAALLVENRYIRFRIELIFRKFFNIAAISMKLRTFEKVCKNGKVYSHCIVFENMMLFTHEIPNCYLKSWGNVEDFHRAYKPLVYFKSSGLDSYEINSKTKNILNTFAEKIIPYTPGDTNLGFSLRKGFPLNITFLLEMISNRSLRSVEYLNKKNILGDLFLPITNPMKKVGPGLAINYAILSETFGTIDALKIEIPKVLSEEIPCYSSTEYLQKENRPPCFMDVGLFGPTWPLRFTINDLDIRLSGFADNMKVKISKSTDENINRLLIKTFVRKPIGFIKRFFKERKASKTTIANQLLILIKNRREERKIKKTIPSIWTGLKIK